MRILFLGCILVGIGAAVPAYAVTEQELLWCEDKGNPPSLDHRLSACNAALQSGRYSGKSLATIHNNLCDVHIKMGSYDRAISECQRAIRLDNDDPDAHYNLGNAYRRKRDYPSALAAYEQAIRVNPSDRSAYFNRALTHLDVGARERAIADFRKALSLGHPRAADELRRLGVTP
jgi:tetratricopeptide (TPR) repeat protein